MKIKKYWDPDRAVKCLQNLFENSKEILNKKIDGTIKSIKVLTNDMVKDNQLLIELS